MAIERGPDDPEVLAIAAQVIGSPGGDLDGGIEIVSKAIALNPNSAYAFRFSGLLHTGRGEIDTALDHLERAARLSPMDTAAALRHRITALAHFVASRYEVALEWTGKALNENPNHFPPLRVRAACLGHLGRLEEGRQVVARILAIRPDETIERARALYRLMLRQPEHQEALLEGLRRVGLPE